MTAMVKYSRFFSVVQQLKQGLFASILIAVFIVGPLVAFNEGKRVAELEINYENLQTLNAKLVASNTALSSKVVELQYKVDNALVSESTVGEAFTNKVATPVSEASSSAWESVKTMYSDSLTHIRGWW